MAADIWTGVGDWNGNPSDWSLGHPPTSSQNADIAGEVTLSGAGAAHSVIVEASGSFASTDAAALTVAGFFASASSSLDFSGSTTISGVFWDPLGAYISSPTANVTVSVGNLALSTGLLLIQGSATTGGVSASVNVAAAPLGGFAGNIAVVGNAKLAYSGSGPSAVDLGADLQVSGAQASVTFNGVSALSTLSANYGDLEFDGNSSLGTGGVTVVSSAAFLNAGEFMVDAVGGADAGGSAVSFAGAFTNIASGSFDLGDSTLTTATAGKFGSLINQGAIDIQGSATGAASAVLTVNGALSTTLVGSWTIAGDASANFTSGAATTVQSQSSLSIDGAGASLQVGGANALGGLSANYGRIDFEGGTGIGAGGVALTFNNAFSNLGYLYIDQQEDGDAGSSIVFKGAYVNDVATFIGYAAAGAGTSVTAASLSNAGILSIVGSPTNATQTTFAVASAVGATVTGQIDISGDAVLSYTSGSVLTVQGQSSLELDGGSASIKSGSANALTKLTVNYGSLSFEGDDDYFGASGVSLTTTTGFTNAGIFNVDTDGDTGESVIQFGGALVNYSIPRQESEAVEVPFLSSNGEGGIFIGNSSLDAATTVSASSLLNEGALTVQGSVTSNIQAKLSISGAAAASLTGVEQIGGDGEILYGSGYVTNIQYGATLDLYGQSATIANGAGSALAQLTFNYGTLNLEGSTYQGAGGVALTTTTFLINDGELAIDNDYGADDSAVSIGGLLTNAGVVAVGNSGPAEPQSTSLQAIGLNNYDLLVVGGGSTSAEVTSSGAVNDYDDIYVLSDGSLSVTGGAAFTQTYGIATVDAGGALSAATVNANGGLLDFRSALTSDDVISSFKIGALGDLEFDGAVDSSRSVAFTAVSGLLSLRDAGAFSGVISGFVGNDEIDLPGVAVTSLSYSGGVLTVNLSGGGVDKLHFSGSYVTASFLALPDGTGGSVIVHAPAAEDVWNGLGDWDGNPADWSLGVPSASRYAIISADSSVTASQSDTALSLTLLSGATLTAESTSTLSIGGFLNNSGTLNFEGATATITGTLASTGSINIGTSSNVAVTAGGLVNEGNLSITGGATSSGPQSTLTVSGAASATLSGGYELTGEATLSFGSGAIKTILKGAALTLNGSGAKVLSGATSAFASLSGNYGVINLEGDTSAGAGGAELTSTSAFTNGGFISIDTNAGAGGSSVAFGALTNADDFSSIAIGNNELSDDDLVSVASLTNEGALNIDGDDALAPTHRAELSVDTAPVSVLTGYIILSGDAVIAYASAGGISSIQYGATLELAGANAQILADGKSALAALATNAGTLTLEGDASGYGAGGVSLTTNGGFSNYGIFYLDNYYGAGGSVIDFKGTFINAGQATIGNGSLGASTELEATGFNNQGQLTVQGDVSGPDEALLAFSGAAAAGLVGDWQVSGDASVTFASGAITSIQYGSSLELDGSAATILSGGASALKTLSLNEGSLTLQGDNLSYGAGGVSFTTTSGFTNVGNVSIDIETDDGGSTANFGAFVNVGSLNVGATELSGDDLVTVASLLNEGYITLQGSLDGSHSATIKVTGTAATGLVGQITILGDASLSYGGGAITSIQEGSALTLYGSSATVLAAGANALTTLTVNYGTLGFHGDNTYSGDGGVSLTTTVAFSNDGSLQVDNNYYEGGSDVNFGGQLRNASQIILGNSALAAADTIEANGIANSGNIQIAGQTEVALSELLSTSAVTNTGDITIDSGGELDASGTTFTQTAGVTTVNGGEIVASSLAASGGLVEYQSAAAGGVSAFSIGQIGDLQFDSSVASSDAVSFVAAGGELGLKDAGQFAGLIKGFAGSDIIDLIGVSVSGYSFASGVLTLTTSSGTDKLAFSGSYSTATFATMNDGTGGTFVLHT